MLTTLELAAIQVAAAQIVAVQEQAAKFFTVAQTNVKTQVQPRGTRQTLTQY